MEKLYKSFDLKSDADTGQISGYFSTYDRIPDSYGDVIAKGAFTDTIKAREDSGHPFPLCWNHDLDQIIGKVDSIEDTEKGPHMVASFFNTPLAQEKREIVKSGVVFQFSFAYDIKDSASVTLEDGTKANELRKLDLYEVSIVPIPANQHAVMTDVKAQEDTEVESKSGRRNKKSDEELIRQIIDLANQLLDDEVTDEVNDADEPDDVVEDQPMVNSDMDEEEPEEDNTRKDNLLAYIKSMEV